MKILKLDSRSVYGTDGSGNQAKIWLNNSLIKINSKYKEASKEVDAYKLGSAMGLKCAEYASLLVNYRGSERRACMTESFLQNGEVEISVAYILDIYNSSIPMKLSAVEYIDIVAGNISDFTGIDSETVYIWLYDMLVFDYIICNDDRHLTNFEVLYSRAEGNYRLAPYYDHGESFFRTDSLLSIQNYEKYEHKFKAKPFSSNPDKNIGDYNRARASFVRMINAAGGINGIKSLDISQAHKLTVLRRIHRLQKLLNVFLKSENK